MPTSFLLVATLSVRVASRTVLLLLLLLLLPLLLLPPLPLPPPLLLLLLRPPPLSLSLPLPLSRSSASLCVASPVASCCLPKPPWLIRLSGGKDELTSVEEPADWRGLAGVAIPPANNCAKSSSRITASTRWVASKR